jgi:hypothetical protein
MDLIASLTLNQDSSSASEPVAQSGSSSREYLQQKETQRKLAEAAETIIPVFPLKNLPLSDYHSQIANSIVEKPRQGSKKGKHMKKVEKGMNYKSKLGIKQSARQLRELQKDKRKNS